MTFFKVLRLSKQLTQLDIQRISGVDATTISLFESGRLQLTDEQKERLHGRVFPDYDRQQLFSNLDFETFRKSNFFGLKHTSAQNAKPGKKAQESINRLDEKR